MFGLSYNLLGTIEAPCDAVNALAFSNDGRYLASASNDMVVRVYDLKRHLSTIWTYRGKSPFTTVVWCKEQLFAGNGDGEIMIFHPVASRLFQSSTAPFTVWNSIVREINFSYVLVPEQLYLGKESQAIGSWYTTLIHQAALKKLQNSENLMCGQSNIFRSSGFTALSPDGTALAISNVRSGIDWLRVYTGSTRWKKISTTLEIQDLSANIPLPVQFIDKGKYILMGTSKGYAVIFHAKHGKRVISLDHGSDKTRVTALAYVHPKNCPQLLATGDGNCGPNTKIKVWIEDTEEKRETASPSGLNGQESSLRVYVRSIVGAVYNVSAVIAWKEFDIPIAKTLLSKHVIQILKPLPVSTLATLDTGGPLSTSSPTASTANSADPTSIARLEYDGQDFVRQAIVSVDHHSYMDCVRFSVKNEEDEEFTFAWGPYRDQVTRAKLVEADDPTVDKARCHVLSTLVQCCKIRDCLTRAWITELQDPGLVYKIRTIATYSSSHRPQPFEVDVELLLELARAGGAAVSMFRVPYLDAPSWILFSRGPTNFGLFEVTTPCDSTMNMVTSEEDEQDILSETLSQERRLCAISTMDTVTSEDDEEDILSEICFDVSNTIFGRFELDSILAKAYQLRPILQLCIPTLRTGTASLNMFVSAKDEQDYEDILSRIRFDVPQYRIWTLQVAQTS
ncbi:WD40-repeat-containing domain protein [Lentinula lateritia]|uniref:WD40-repeat-containing domain protein n=1 Tax=Lentinula aff. lateritia TaxID=2804960 RepID=A0ACC1U054_9AGAR|nr:WD40-repeat-containing domain protein [Lentinula aff. lateritia]KAJ3856735.1 WD40-repeat-containing domain protein [Lentinula lateritia]